MLRAYKYRIYPTENQVQQIEQTFGCCRLVHNLALEVKMYAYKQHGVNYSAYDLVKQLSEMKQDYEWMLEPESHALQGAVHRLDTAFKNFFNGAGYPKFKRKNNRESYQCFDGCRKIDFENNLLTIPKIKDIPIALDKRKIKGQIKTVTISKTPTGKYFASILVDTQVPLPEKRPINISVGIDVGVKTFAVLSDGTSYENKQFGNQEEERLKILKRRASKKLNRNSTVISHGEKIKSEGKNKAKANKKVAKIYEKVTNRRNDYIHKTTNEITNRCDTICVEDFAVKNLTKRCKSKQDAESGKYLPNGQAAKSGINKAILDVGLGEFFRQLKYKSEWKGNNFVKVDRFFPSSQTCSHCGFQNKTLTLKDREWDCPSCGEHLERDPNASENIRVEGLRILKTGTVSSEEPAERRTMVRAKGAATRKKQEVMDAV